ncbi:hypothetical protein C6A37_10005, partial [Desulfobacteraceae bacterium SEEP-SAG9]
EQILDSILEPGEKTPDGEQISFLDHGVEVKIRANWITPKSSETENPDHRICITLIGDWEERTPDSIRNFLEQHHIIVKDVLRKNKNSTLKPKQLQSRHVAQDVITIDSWDRKAFVKVFLRPSVGITRKMSVLYSHMPESKFRPYPISYQP